MKKLVLIGVVLGIMVMGAMAQTSSSGVPSSSANTVQSRDNKADKQALKAEKVSRKADKAALSKEKNDLKTAVAKLKADKAAGVSKDQLQADKEAVMQARQKLQTSKNAGNQTKYGRYC
jgi:hypothetical protein